MKYTKTVWKDLPDTSTPITADKLNNLENGVEYLFENGVGGGGETLPVGTEVDYDGTEIPTGWEQINNPNIYSTEEVKTNKIWKDGKPIYRKVISTIVSRILDELNSLNVDSVVDLKGNYDSNYDFNWEINSNVPEANYRFSIYRVKSTKAFNGSHGDFISGTNSIEVTIEYTKTTD